MHAAGATRSCMRKHRPVDLSRLDLIVEYKNKGNKYFKEGKYSDSIKCYQQAIDICPKDNTDISVFHQNRAAAFEQLVTTS